jgi:hypothetical protein
VARTPEVAILSFTNSHTAWLTSISTPFMIQYSHPL